MKITILAPTLFKHDYNFQINRYVNEIAKESDDITIFTLKANITPTNANLCILGMPKKFVLAKSLPFSLSFRFY